MSVPPDIRKRDSVAQKRRTLRASMFLNKNLTSVDQSMAIFRHSHMQLLFPNSDVLMLALTSGAVPQEIAVAAAGAETQNDGSIVVEIAGKLSKASLVDLAKWGVVPPKRAVPLKNAVPVQNWLQLFPLQSSGRPEDISDRTQVLFELKDPLLLTELVNEMLRQGNDRQSVRTVADDASSDGNETILLRVAGPPYYSLLRASGLSGANDSSADSRGSHQIRAFVEQAPRVWVQAGYRHPLTERITPAPGQHLLLEAPAVWRTLREQPFRDVYEVLEFRLTEQPRALQNTVQEQRLTVPVKLTRGGTDDAAEIFVLTKDAFQQLDRFIQSSGDDVLQRLAFAVMHPEGSDQPVIVVRIRPGKSAPPVLVFDGLACRQYLRIPNLFVPVGHRLHPPLRRDAIRRMLADDETQLVWLSPKPSGASDGSLTSFVPYTVSDTAFLPLTSWVDYVLDSDHRKLTHWVRSHRFDFDEFICQDDLPVDPPERKPVAKKKKAAKSKAVEETKEVAADDRTSVVQRLIQKFQRNALSSEPESEEVLRLQQTLAELEADFVQLDAPLDDPARQAMWSDMAGLNSALQRYSDASICRQHELWEADEPDPAVLEAWFRVEVDGSERSGAPTMVTRAGNVTDREFLRALKSQNPAPGEVAQLAAYVAWSSRTAAGEGQLKGHLSDVQQYLERHEGALAVRSSWLAWSLLSQFTGDVLTLARARDRVLERLFQNGLTVDRDLPTFLRTSGAQSSERFRMVREKVADLHRTVQKWSAQNLGIASEHTSSYIDLIFAFALARLGEHSRASELLATCERELPIGGDAVHRWLFSAYRYRIRMLLDGRSAVGPLPQSMLDDLEMLSRDERYKTDQLRQHSSILEPIELLNPYGAWQRREDGDLQKALSELFDLTDRDKLASEIRKLLNRKCSADDLARILTTALGLSPRLGESFTETLDQVLPADRKLKDPLLRQPC
ncbi:MAG: hypothetical protein R3C49_28150 [Planctomycetaceae bacterium]